MGNCCRKETKGAGKGGGDAHGKLAKIKRKRSLEPSVLHHVDDKQDFTNQLKLAGDKLVVVDFYATWCGPCKMIKPKLEELAEQMKAEKVIFMKVDVDECEDVTNDYGVSSMPTFILIKNSEKVEEMTGVNLDRLKELITSKNG